MLTILGLLLNLVGIVCLFLFEMPFRVTSDVTTATWSLLGFGLHLKKLDDIYTILGWFGLLALVLGTLLQMLVPLRPRW